MADQVPDREEMARLLKAHIQKQRPRSLRTVVILLAVAAAPLALLVWLLWPRPDLPRLKIIAFDQLGRPEESVPVEAWLTPQDAKTIAPDLRGLEISFEALAHPAQLGGKAPPGNARSESTGQAMAPWQTPGVEGVVELKVAHSASRPRYRTEDRARLFVWKAESPLLVVEVSAAAAGEGKWWLSNLLDISARNSADMALHTAHAKRFQIVYLATGAAVPLDYRLMRAWVETKTQEGGPFPDGPVLGQLPRPGTVPAGRDWAERLANLKRRGRGPLVAVAKDPHFATMLRDAGATTFLIAAGIEAPPGTTSLASWADLPPRLKD